MASYTGIEIAVIGLGLRFPGANDPEGFWENLQRGKESIRFHTDEELLQLGYDSQTLADPGFVKTPGGLPEDAYRFDANFFGYTPKEAKIMDPQMRVFHEVTWQAIEDAGYNVRDYKGRIGLYAGRAPSTVWDAYNLLANKTCEMSTWEVEQYTNSDFMCSKIAYKLNLKGPAYVIDTACSTSLVAVHVACRALLMGECDMALAGGVTISPTEHFGYRYIEGMAKSRDGHCRAFDKEGSGFVKGQGAGVVLLKPLEKAIKDKDHIYAVIKGSAVSNDGSQKVGFTAPSVEGQIETIKSALKISQVPQESITYIEAHGAGTPLGDPIEIRAMAKVFSGLTKKFCAIGSVKTNIGHLDRASGIAGFIKTVLSLKHQKIPPSLNFREVNPNLEIEYTPFYVNEKLQNWRESRGQPRRAGVTSLGIGGNNSHVILEEYNNIEEEVRGGHQLLLVSAKSVVALQKSKNRLIKHLTKHKYLPLEQVAYTLQVGRESHRYGDYIVAGSTKDLLLKWKGCNMVSDRMHARSTAFIFSGQGSQYLNMGKGIIENLPLFKIRLKQCLEVYQQANGVKLWDILYPTRNDALDQVNEVIYSGPIKFSFEYSLAVTLIEMGIKPDFVVGHSFGEYTAACLAGVFSLRDALKLVHYRGIFMAQTGVGAMLSVKTSEQTLNTLLEGSLAIAAINDDANCIVSGSRADIEELLPKLELHGIEFVKLNFPKAAHSELMTPIVSDFTRILQTVEFRTPTIKYVSSLTGAEAFEELTSINYWINHLLNTVQYHKAIEAISSQQTVDYIQPGCDKGITFFASQANRAEGRALELVRGQNNPEQDWPFFLRQLGTLWSFGLNPTWSYLYPTGQTPARLPLPTYAFDHQQEFPKIDLSFISSGGVGLDQCQIENSLYGPIWKLENQFTQKAFDTKETWLIFEDQHKLSGKIVSAFLEEVTFIKVRAGSSFQVENNVIYLNPENASDYEALFTYVLEQRCLNLTRILHLWAIDSQKGIPQDESQLLGYYYYSLLYLAKAWIYHSVDSSIAFDVCASNSHQVIGGDLWMPLKATADGLLKVMFKEIANLHFRTTDVDFEELDEPWLIRSLMSEFQAYPLGETVAFRRGRRYRLKYLKTDILSPPGSSSSLIEENDTLLIAGGTGGIGLVLANFLATKAKVHLILVNRTALQQTSIENRVRIQAAISKIESKGSTVAIIQGDICHHDSMDKIASVLRSVGKPLKGIIHAAGLIDTGSLLANRSREETERIMAPKIMGTYNLAELGCTFEVKFLMLCSSINSISPIEGQASHAAANAFLDAFSHADLYPEFRIFSINWSAWSEVGQASASGEELKSGLTNHEGARAFELALNYTLDSQIIVEKGDLSKRYMLTKNVTSLDDCQGTKSQVPASRPDTLIETYSPPRSAIEDKLLTIWKNILGYESIGINDDFFTLGGTSLNLVALSVKIFKMFGVKISIEYIYSANSILKQARLLEMSNQELQQMAYLMGEEKDQMVFCFPPAIAYPYCYDGLAKHLSDVTLCGLGFDEDDQRMIHYTSIVNDHQSEGPIVLLAYSMGGVLAFQVAAELQKANRTVTDIILMDCIWHGNREAKDLNRGEDFFAEIEDDLRKMKLEFMADQIRKKVVGYFDYTYSYFSLPTIHANIHCIISSESSSFEGSVTDWKKFATGDCKIYNGLGDHSNMLSEPYLGQNASLISSILSQVLRKENKVT